VMQNPGTLEKPYYYVNVVSKYNPDCAPVGNEALFFVCPVPNLLYKTDWVDKEDIIDSIVADFSKRIHQDISKNIVFRKSFTPEDWQDRFNLYKGAGLGLSHAMNQIGAFDRKMPMKNSTTRFTWAHLQCRVQDCRWPSSVRSSQWNAS